MDEQEKLDEVIGLLTQFRWTLGYFLLLLFSDFGNQYSQRRTRRHAAYVSTYLGGRDSKKVNEDENNNANTTNTSLPNILSLIYDHADGTPAHDSTARDLEYLARPQISAWCQSVVTSEITKEAEKLTKREAGLHLPRGSQEWQTLSNFSMSGLFSLITTTAPVLYALLDAVATSKHAGQALPETRSDKLRDPKLVSLMAILMLLVCRNQQLNLFQKLIGVWLFACSAPAHVFRVLCRLGISVAYNTVLDIYKQLTEDSIKVTRSLAAQMRFLVIFDNINRTRRFWRPSLGQLDSLMSGTAATLVELLERTASGAFNLLPVFEARKQQRRLSLTHEELYDRIDQEHLSSVMALHCVGFLVSNCASLSHLSKVGTRQI
ncbi:hypothetical protein FRC09_006112 [Ceratobasidium sp. 395]|nr:hypothetical protein FRC09_006112 [Ceratobasidium sp. 395]